MTMSMEALFWIALFSAPLGGFLIVRRLSFYGDALSHSALAGVACAVLLGSVAPLWLSVGAVIATLFTSQMVRFFERRWQLPADLALTAASGGMLALGLLLAASAQVNVELLLLGNLSQISEASLWFVRIWALLVLGCVLWKWRAMWSTALDPRWARTLGYSVERTDFLFLLLASVSVVGLIQSVGAILVPAVLVLPAASVWALSRSLKALIIGSILVAWAASGLGYWAAQYFHLATGPTIAFVSFAIFCTAHFYRHASSGKN